MRYFPIFLNISDKTCLIVGAGSVGLRKIKTLMSCSPEKVIVIDPFTDSLDIQDQDSRLTHLKESFNVTHLEGCSLVFACTNDPEVNEKVARACQEKNILCNVAETPDQGDFILPGVFSRQDLIIAVSTCGCSPALTARIKQDLSDIYGPEYALLTELLAAVRKIILPLDLPQKKNREYFRAIVDSEALPLLKQGKSRQLAELLQQILPSDTHNEVQGVVNDLI
ncbi:precorrin-2 dehydrogenase/sirohydrochlorin ferrochelatase family protein [Desulfonatronovibrio magnus]|uniref:precorrin-2 dehydrogenase/sirohydrochlorin ferrochelatase family protein n=1 Tax=Desulfonatronovibrio magnus TaxID=698827 RepID=UPI0005EB48DD|nr:bifunctional precorrin-2 dehydrogenase/sirohydrochlorin ferrochelatase [Desulfonatronovibrio magnus]